MAKYYLTDLFEGNYSVSQGFGENAAYYKQISGGTLKGHEGVDFATPTGTWLIVPFSKGQVIQTGYHPAYGSYVVLWDSIQKCAVWYCHMSAINCSPGQILSRGARVGRTGASGNVTGPHLHAMFVETDENANRLDRNNGYTGYKNILDRNLVAFGTPPPALTKEQQMLAIINTSITDTKFRQEVRKIYGV